MMVYKTQENSLMSPDHFLSFLVGRIWETRLWFFFQLINNPTPIALVQEDFNGFDYSLAQTLSSQLLQIPQTPQPPQNAGTAKQTVIGAVVGVVIVLLMMVVIGVVGCVLYARLR